MVKPAVPGGVGPKNGGGSALGEALAGAGAGTANTLVAAEGANGLEGRQQSRTVGTGPTWMMSVR